MGDAMPRFAKREALWRQNSDRFEEEHKKVAFIFLADRSIALRDRPARCGWDWIVYQERATCERNSR